MISIISSVSFSGKEVQSQVPSPQEDDNAAMDDRLVDLNFKLARELLRVRSIYLQPTPPPTLHHVILPNDKPTN